MDYILYTDAINKIAIEEGKKQLISTINQYSYCIAEQDPVFKESLLNSDILLPDGEGIVKAVRILDGKTIQKIAGADLHKYLLELLNIQKGRCFYLGSSEDTLKKIQSKLNKEYPEVKVGFFSPPFKVDFSKNDNTIMIQAVNAFKPDVLFVGMTAPKQEKWAYHHKQELDAKVICCIGAVFDFYAGTVSRPGNFWIKMGLEWLVRLIKEPKRMWKRYLYFGPIFVYLIFKEKLNRNE